MKYQAENAVSSFFYYMWNSWSEEECKTVFKEMHPHFWEKWNLMAGKGIFGAAERFYAELTDRYREKLAERAVSLYDGKAHRRIPSDTDILVCSECGSTEVMVQAWVDANTKEYGRDMYNNGEKRWCDNCRSAVGLCYKDEFTEKMQAWWRSCDFMAMEWITGLKESDYPSDDGSQAFAEAADEWWQGKSYDEKCAIYQENN